MVQYIPSLPFAFALLLGMLVCLEMGRRKGLRTLAEDGKSGGSSTVEGSIFGLYALLIAFTFSGAPARLDARKQLVAEEANAIGTAYLRIDLLRPDLQPPLRELFRQYVDSRLEVYRQESLEAANEELVKSGRIQLEIWDRAVAGTALSGNHPDAGKFLIPALNDMIDITTTRTMAALIHPPVLIFGLLFLLAMVCSGLAGVSMAGYPRRWMHIAAFSIITVISVFVILEIEFPRLGVLRLLESSDQVLVDVRTMMNTK